VSTVYDSSPCFHNPIDFLYALGGEIKIVQRYMSMKERGSNACICGAYLSERFWSRRILLWIAFHFLHYRLMLVPDILVQEAIGGQRPRVAVRYLHFHSICIRSFTYDFYFFKYKYLL